MFGLQASKIKQLTSGVPGLGWLGDLLGDCEAELEHSGPVSLNGPTTIGGQLKDRKGNLIIDGDRGLIVDIDVNEELEGPFPIDVVITMVCEGTLDGDLTRDGTQTITLIDPTTDAAYSPTQSATVHGRYVPTGKKVSSGSRIGAFWNGVRWRAKVTDGCVVDV